ncbi:MAG: bifunctional diaminohydroxyphosphoribosylaminopyrimidine deaminase/5-amino-6-(5-phosphoribosylamino)uracil reductase RibD [Desulfovibrio sp.]|nr:bifunctional diaminohydroxyphosphoribosylaminopyrimidine deaminase/5-amino-6-(5-phosphoribosylamino)uracil reductase RibD [Desulfovibrio sp.]
MGLSCEAYAPFMHQAISLAKQASLKTYPNPAVGCVLVKEGKVVAQGWHHGAGQAHAEIECLNHAKAQGLDLAKASLVVTLEPCNHYGKTPPCTRAILEAGIKEVVYGLKDPNPEAAGGAEFLRSHGVEVLGGVLEEACRDLVADFLIWTEKKRPYILLKMAATMDGRIATRTGQSKWISSPESRAYVHKLRAAVGCAHGIVLVGGKTFRHDNPRLTARLNESEDISQPLAAVFTSHLPSPKDDFVLVQERPTETIFLGSAAAAASTQANELRKHGVRVIPVPQYINGATDLTGLFRGLFSELGCPYVLCEGGGQLATSLLEENLVDEFHLQLAPLIIGDNDALPLFQGRMPSTLDDCLRLRCTETRLLGPDAFILLKPTIS